jgi:hypothetical protein
MTEPEGLKNNSLPSALATRSNDRVLRSNK